MFLNECAACHAFDARGGPGFTDVDLMRTPITYMDITGRELESFLVTHPEGRPPLALTSEQVVDVQTWLRYEASDFVSGRGGPRHNVFSGDAAAGEAFFSGPIGQCSTCHLVTGDLRGIGAKTNDDAPTLQAAIVSGSAGGGVGPSVTATVTLENGQQFVGTPMTVNDWLVEIRLEDGVLLSWLPRDGWPKVVTVNRLQAHIDLTLKYRDEDIRNLAAYLRDK
jgi:mono/diheme cytochrome c family protein